MYVLAHDAKKDSLSVSVGRSMLQYVAVCGF